MAAPADLTTHGDFLAQFNLTENVQRLERREVTIGSVIESLAPVFTSSDVKQRSKSYEILRDILEQLPAEYLNQEEVKVIAAFLIQRLKHENSALPTILQCVHSLCYKYELDDNGAVELFDVLAKEVVVQQQQVVERFKIYQTVSKLIKIKGEILSTELKLDFIINFLKIIEGERDPRCLLLIFKMFREVVTNHDVGHMDEDAFEVISCYFPVAYNQPKNDPYNIARSDLAIALNACFSSSSKFAKYGIPLMMEKLSSDLDSAKIDSYEVLSVCCPVYGWNSIKPFMSLIWNLMRKDLLKVGDFEANDLTNAALMALGSLVMELSNDKETVEYFLSDLMKDVEPGLIKSDLHLRPAAVQIIIAATPKPSSFRFLFEKVIRFLLEGASRDTQYNSKCFLLKCIDNFLMSKQNMLKELFVEEPIDHQPALISLCINNIHRETDSQLIALSLNLLHRIVKVLRNISDNDSELINDCLLNMFMSCDNEDRLDVIASIFRELQDFDRLTVSSSLFQMLNKVMSYEDMHEDNRDDATKVFILLSHCRLPAADQLRIVHEATATMAIGLSAHNGGDAQIKSHDYEIVAKVIAAQIIGTKELTLEGNIEREMDVKKQLLKTNFLDILLPNLMNSIHCSITPTDVFEGCIKVLNAFIREAKKSGQLSDYKEALLGNESKPSNRCPCSDTQLKDVSKLKLLHPLLISLEAEDIDEKSLKSVDEQLCLPDSVVAANLPLLTQAITSLANKCNDDLMTNLVNLITKDRSQDTTIKIKVLSALLKGLVMRCHQLSNQITSHCLKYFDTPGQEFVVADCIIQCHEIGAFEQEHLTVNPFFHQKLFLDSLPILLSGIKAQVSQSSSDARRKAILGQLKFLPKNVIKTEVRRIQSIILTSLTDECLEIQLVSIQSLYDLLSDNSSTFVTNNLSTIVPRLLNICATSRKLDVRKQALECLTVVAKGVPEIHLLPIRTKTIKGLKSCLNDPKRLVRMAAAEASCRWTMVGQSGTA